MEDEDFDDVADIEDLLLPATSPSAQRAEARGVTLTCTSKACDSPGLGSVWVKTYGCSLNVSDGEYIAGLLSSYGYRCRWFISHATVHVQHRHSKTSCAGLSKTAIVTMLNAG